MIYRLLSSFVLIAILAARYTPQTIRHLHNKKKTIAYTPRSVTKSWHLVVIFGLLTAYAIYCQWALPFAIWRTALGLGICASGAALGVAAAVSLKDQYCEELLRYKGFELVTDGVFSVVRHPARTGMFLEACGMCIIASDTHAFIGLGALSVVQFVRTVEEDAMLRAYFGSSAATYSRTVPAFNVLKGIVRRICSDRASHEQSSGPACVLRSHRPKRRSRAG
jgi:protein-S-isoprenylcysteine O-methyltransferase Ste14